MVQPEQVLAGYQRAILATRTAVTGAATRLWGAQPDYRDANVDVFVRQVVPIVQAGKLRTANLTAAYIRESARARGDSVPMALVDRDQILGARKVDPTVEYGRPAITLYTALSNGASFVEAQAQGLSRLTDLVQTDLQLAKTTQSQASLKSSNYTYYRRVLTGSENCALCSIASTQRYHVSDLMPIHPGCDCAVEQVSADFDPGLVIDSQFLEETHAHVDAFYGSADRGGRDPDYRKLIITREHGEWGPTLTWLSDHFTGPDDLAA